MRKPKTTKPSPAASPQLDQWMQQGLALHQSGRGGEAATLYRQVLARQPAHPAANHLLGLVRLQQGDPAAAVELISRAVAQRGDDPQYHCNLGVALNAAGQPERAILSLGRAIELKPDYAEAYSNRGMALKSLGRAAEAVLSYRRAIELKPAEAGFHLNLGNAQTDLGDLHEAEASYRKALELRPGYPAALSALGLTLRELGRTDEAVAAGEAAVASRPGEVEFHRGLARAYQSSRQLARAAASYRRALAIDPDRADIHRQLSELIFHVSHDEDVAAMERLYAAAVAGSGDRMALGYGLGKAFDDLGDYPRSLGYFREANTIKRRMEDFSLEQTRRDVLAIQQLFDTVPPPPLLNGGFRNEAPIFIVGLPRSGKTSLEQMLARHPRVYGAGELRVLVKLASDFIIKYDLTATGADLSAVPPQALVELGTDYVRYVRSLAPAPLVSIDTMPQNFRIIGLIRLALPHAKVVHCVRDKAEHCIALFQKHFARPGYEFTCNWDELAGFYALYEQMMAHWHRLFPSFLRDVELAEVRADPEGQMRELLGFCGLEWDDACLELVESEPQLGQELRNPAAAGERLRYYKQFVAALPGQGS